MINSWTGPGKESGLIGQGNTLYVKFIFLHEDISGILNGPFLFPSLCQRPSPDRSAGGQAEGVGVGFAEGAEKNGEKEED